MKYTILLFLLCLNLPGHAQTVVSLKVGTNPVFIDAGQNYRSQAWSLDGGWGYRAGMDISYKLSRGWSLFHGAALSVNKLKYSHWGYSAISGNYNSYIEGYQAQTLSIPVGIGHHFKIAKITSQLRGMLEWNIGIGGNVKGYQTDFNAVGNFNRKIDFLNRETIGSGMLRHNRFSIGFESITQIFKTVSFDFGYTYSMKDVMFENQLPGKHSKIQSVFIGLNCDLVKYRNRQKKK
jgi:hypothetical protein